MNPKTLRYIGAGFGILVLVIVLGFAVWSALGTLNDDGPKFVPQEDKFLFVRDLTDPKQNDPKNIVSQAGDGLVGGVSLADVCSEKQKGRYGVDTAPPDGVGGTAILRQVVGNGPKAKTHDEKTNKFIPRWEVFEEENDNDARFHLVEAGCKNFATAATEFMAPVTLKKGQGIALDRTEGIDAELEARVRATVDGFHPDLLELSDTPYNTLKPSTPENVAEWLRPKPGLELSSIFGGLLEDVKYASQQFDVYRLDVYTDGIENTPDISLYKRPELLDPKSWSELDKAFNLSGLNLSGLEVHIHPLKPHGETSSKLQPLAHDYLKTRLEGAGAKVIVESYMAP